MNSAVVRSPNRRRALSLAGMSAMLMACGVASGFESSDPRVAAAKEGVDYRTLPKPQPTHTEGGRTEIIEFFGYWCPHCDHFEPVLRAWVTARTESVQLKRFPVAFRPEHVTLARLYCTLDVMGIEDRHRQQVFAAIHQSRTLSSHPEAGELIQWATSEDIDHDAFVKAFNSPAVDARLLEAGHAAKDYQVDGVPMLVVGGRYTMIPDERRMILADALLDEVRKVSVRSR